MKWTDDVIARYATYDIRAMLRDIEPLFCTKPVYVICKTLSNHWLLPSDYSHARGWTGTKLASRCRPYLESIGAWEGADAFCMIFNEPVRHWTDSRFLSTCVHEPAHWCEWQVTTDERHGPTWIRAALHLAHRASRWLSARGIRFSKKDVLSNSGVSSVDRYAIALGAELNQTHKATCWHLRQPPPPPFTALCNVDARDSGRPLPFAQLEIDPLQCHGGNSKVPVRAQKKSLGLPNNWMANVAGRLIELGGGYARIDGRDVGLADIVPFYRHYTYGEPLYL